MRYFLVSYQKYTTSRTILGNIVVRSSGFPNWKDLDNRIMETIRNDWGDAGERYGAPTINAIFEFKNALDCESFTGSEFAGITEIPSIINSMRSSMPQDERSKPESEKS